MAYSAGEKSIIWLCACTPFDERERTALLRAARDPALLLPEFEKICAAAFPNGCGRVYNGDRTVREREADQLIASLEKKGYFALTCLDEDYPVELRYISAPPLVLYGAGKRELLSTDKFCIVGARLLPPWAEKQCRLFSEAISKRFTVVTGLAEGGDRAAIEGALGSGNLISVLPNGLDLCYPAAHADLKERVKRAGLLLSEYPPREGARKYSFYARNRLLAGLSKGVLVVAAGKRSGTSITANYALEYGREVFAFPHNLGVKQGEGCNELIKKGAYLAAEPADILSVFGVEAEDAAPCELSAEEKKIVGALSGEGELHVAEIAERAGMPVYEAAAILAALEMKNVVLKSGGNRYAIV